MKKYRLKAILSMGLVLALALSLFPASGWLTAAADNAVEYAVVTDGLDETYMKELYQYNLIAGKAFVAEKIGGGELAPNGGWAPNWTDGNLDNGDAFYNGPGRFIYDLGSEFALSEILLFAAAGNGEQHQKYQISIAKEKADLFSGERSTDVLYVNESNKRAVSIQFSEETHPIGRYVAVEIHGMFGNNIFMDEIGVYGAMPLPDGCSVETENLDSGYVDGKHKMNLIAGLSFTAERLYGEKFDPDQEWAPNWTDGKLDNGGAIYNGPGRFVYDLGSEFELSEVLLFAASGNGEQHQRYRVSVAREKDGLFNSEQSADVWYVNESSKRALSIQFADGKRPIGRYVAVEILGMFGNNIFMDEIGVYGTGPVQNEYTIVTDGLDADYVTGKNNGNLVAGQAFSAKTLDGAPLTPDGGWAPNWTDGKLDNGDAFYNGPGRFIFDLDKVCDINEILLMAASGNGAQHQRYRISIADTEEALFTSGQNAEICYVNGDKKNTLSFQYKDSEHPRGRFVGIEIHGMYSNNIFMDEIGVYGTVPLPDGCSVVTEGLDVAYVSDRHYQNILKNKDYTAVKSDSSTYEPEGVHWKGNWTNGVISETNQDQLWGVPVGDVRARFIYDLGRSYEISEILHISCEGRTLPRYRVSVAMTEDALFTDKQTAEILYVNADSVRGQSFQFKENKRPVGRYIAFEIIRGFEGNNLFVDELGVYGRSVEAPPELHATYDVRTTGIDSDYLSERMEDNLLLGIMPELTNDMGVAGVFNGGTPWNMVDGQVYVGSHVDYMAPGNADEPVRFTYDLLQSVVIDEFLLVSYYGGHPLDYTTQEYELYVSDTLDDLYTDKNRMVYYDNRFQYNPAVPYCGAPQGFTFTGDKPRGRYVGLRVIDMSGADNYGRLDQVAIYSAGAKPLDAESAQFFTDEATGITVSIQRKDMSDSFDMAAGIRVSQIPLDQAAQEMADSFYLKALGRAFKIELLDQNGKAIDEATLDGRILKITFPVPEAEKDISRLLCTVEDGELHRITTFWDADVATVYVYRLGTFALFEDTLNHGIGLPGDAGLDHTGGSGVPDTGVGYSVAWLALLPAAATMLVVSTKKRRGGREQ